MDRLAKLRPRFMSRIRDCRQLFADERCAAAPRHVERFAKERELTPMARFVAYATAGVAPERFAPDRPPCRRSEAGGTHDGPDRLIELNEAFAAQVLACS